MAQHARQIVSDVPVQLKTVHVVVSGFGQDRGDPTGCDKLWRRLYSEFASAETLVLFCEWDQDMDAVARMIWRHSGSNGESPLVTLAAYSWGLPTAIKLSKQLWRRGIQTEVLTSCDGVYRRLWRLWAVWFRHPVVSIPPCIRRVEPFRQKVDWPFGHQLVAEDDQRTVISATRWADRGHFTMDELPGFQARSYAAAVRVQWRAGLIDTEPMPPEQ